jgi:hypothetical protein
VYHCHKAPPSMLHRRRCEFFLKNGSTSKM